MPSLDVTFELVTPAFAGAADRTKTDGLRPPALKGLLRFWWRTTYPAMRPRDLVSREGALFGSQNGDIGQRLVVVPGPAVSTGIRQPRTPAGDPLHTYFGYGPVAWQKKGSRPDLLQQGRSELVTPQLNARTRRQVRFAWRNPDPTVLKELASALWLIAAFGGYGGRSRRGWGQLRLSGTDLHSAWADLGLNDPHEQQTPANVVACLASGLARLVGRRASLPLSARHTAFTACTRLVVGPVSDSADAAHRAAALCFIEYRRALGAVKGHAPGVWGPDFDLRKQWSMAAGPRSMDQAPVGSAFGLPHHAKYVSVAPGRDLGGRRASPLFVAILQVQKRPKDTNVPAVPVFLWAPTRFLPRDKPIWVDGGGAKRSVRHPPRNGVPDFFDGASIPQGAGPTMTWPGLTTTWNEVPASLW